MAISKKMRTWREKQRRGAIMKPSTFARIKAKAARKYGAKRAARIAGSAYWRSLKSKYKKKKR